MKQASVYVRLLGLGMVLGMMFLALAAGAQEAASAEIPRIDQAKDKNIPQRPVTGYKLEFILSEVEDGKKVNVRSYSMSAQDDGTLNKLRIGARIPVPESPFIQGNPTQYLFHDIGVNIDCRLQQRESALLMDTTVDASTISQPAMAGDSTHMPPVVHSLRAEIRSVITPGKQTTLTSMDDPTSKREFEIVVTATKLK
jgi:hypothetical protein